MKENLVWTMGKAYSEQEKEQIRPPCMPFNRNSATAVLMNEAWSGLVRYVQSLFQILTADLKQTSDIWFYVCWIGSWFVRFAEIKWTSAISEPVKWDLMTVSEDRFLHDFMCISSVYYSKSLWDRVSFQKFAVLCGITVGKSANVFAEIAAVQQQS
jgi:hypothetical protein